VAFDGSPLVQRVERLVTQARGAAPAPSRVAWVPAVLAGVIVAAVLCASGPVLSAAPRIPPRTAVPRHAVLEVETVDVALDSPPRGR
jgi:hypothetical protein